MTTPSETALSAEEPVLRLTGKQIESIDPPPEGDWFVDFDEFEEFVPKRLLDAARSQPATEGLREALEQALYRLDDIGEHLRPDMTDDDKHAIAQAWWFGSEEIRVALAATEPARDDRT